MSLTLDATDLATRFLAVERQIAKQKGNFVLFALVLREDETNQWDLLVAAPWAQSDELATVRYIAKQIEAILGPDGLREISRIIVVNPEDPTLEAYTANLNVAHSIVRVPSGVFFGLPIKDAYIITAKRPTRD